MAASSFLFNAAKTMGMIQTNTTTQHNLCYWSSTTASYYITLVSNSYIPSESHMYASAISGHECSGTSFTAGFNGTMRISLTGRLLNVNQTSNQVEFVCSQVSWAGIGATQGTAHAFVIIQQSGSDALSPLITYNSLGGFPITFNGTTLTLSLTSAGIFAGVDF